MSDSAFDPDVSAAFGSSPAPSVSPPTASFDPDVEAAFSSDAQSTQNQPPVTLLQTAKNEVNKFLNPFPQGVNKWATSLPGVHNVPQESPFNQSVDRAVNTVSNAPQKAGDVLQNAAIKAGANPYVAAAAGMIPSAGQMALQAEFAGPSLASRAGAEGASSYAAEEEAETGRLGNIHDRAEAKGYQIPEQGSPATLSKAASNNQALVDNDVKANFGLSSKAPATPQMLANWRAKFAANSTYAEVRSTPAVQLDDDAAQSLANLPKPLYDRLDIDNKVSPNNVISGDDLADVSQALRARSSQLWKTSKMFPEYEDQAVAMDKAVDNVEDSATPYMKDPEQWNLDRAKIAQSYDAQSALDGGHFDARDLARLKFAKNSIKPWTGDMSDIADLAQLHPEAFQLTRTPLPQYSALRKGLAWGAGALASYGAGKLGAGAISHAIGQSASNTITPP